MIPRLINSSITVSLAGLTVLGALLFGQHNYQDVYVQDADIEVVTTVTEYETLLATTTSVSEITSVVTVDVMMDLHEDRNTMNTTSLSPPTPTIEVVEPSSGTSPVSWNLSPPLSMLYHLWTVFSTVTAFISICVCPGKLRKSREQYAIQLERQQRREIDSINAIHEEKQEVAEKLVKVSEEFARAHEQTREYMNAVDVLQKENAVLKNEMEHLRETRKELKAAKKQVEQLQEDVKQTQQRLHESSVAHQNVSQNLTNFGLQVMEAQRSSAKFGRLPYKSNDPLDD